MTKNRSPYRHSWPGEELADRKTYTLGGRRFVRMPEEQQVWSKGYNCFWLPLPAPEHAPDSHYLVLIVEPYRGDIRVGHHVSHPDKWVTWEDGTKAPLIAHGDEGCLSNLPAYRASNWFVGPAVADEIVRAFLAQLEATPRERWVCSQTGCERLVFEPLPDDTELARQADEIRATHRRYHERQAVKATLHVVKTPEDNSL